MAKQFDVVVVGAGIVGLAVADRLQTRVNGQLRILLLEKEPRPATHQTGRNSGVVHSGIYYKPGSAKATNCRRGRSMLIEFCEAEGIPLELCGKVIVATDEAEKARLPGLLERGQQNGVRAEAMELSDLKEREPHVAAIGALLVHDTGIVDYGAVARRLAERVQEKGGIIWRNTPFKSARVEDHRAFVRTGDETVETRVLVNCAGLYSDRVARASGARFEHQIVPFRGDYYTLHPDVHHLCRHLIYPVPDPAFPFLGVHFTRMIHGGVECGPNAVLAFAREGYTLTTLSPNDLAETATFGGFWKLATRHMRTGLAEMWRSASKGAFVRALRKLMPEIRSDHLERAPAGVRAQALGPDGSLVDDFLFVDQGPAVHVLNAPSPAATSSLSIGETVTDRVLAAYRRAEPS
ncbi:MAG TPA: L-2-hydroxyglutarate oxidase [Myxococcales bacterium LLY-WYZ-16_1]|nr:L-2-hydroxyglutarate oxidase [Myxococcales bacterium LLY-WYZ-16_1]